MSNSNQKEAELFGTVHAHHATKARAEKLAASLAAEWPMLNMAATTNDNDELVSWSFVHADGEGKSTTFLQTEDKQVPDLADVLDAAQSAELDMEQEEKDRSGSVVPLGYRIQYQIKSSTGCSCGDWLAEWLTLFLNGDGKLDVEAFMACLVENDVDTSRSWATSVSPGWQGRLRMSGRIQLEKLVAFRGHVIHDGKKVNVPAEDLAALRRKHVTFIAQAERAAQLAK